MPEALRATKDPCTRQHLHRLCDDKKRKTDHEVEAIEVVTLDGADSITTASTLTEYSSQKKRIKKTRKSSRDKNAERRAMKSASMERQNRRDQALSEGLALLEYADQMKKKVARNKSYVYNQIKKDANFKKPMGVRNIVCAMNKKYGVKGDERPISRTTLSRYKLVGIANRQKVGAPEHIPTGLLNTMQLHIKVLQLSKQGQASGRMVKGKLTAAAMGTPYEGFDSDWAWRRIREMYPEEVAPTSVSTQESIRNEWTTFTKVNDWFTMNKTTLIESGLAIDKPERLSDDIEAEVTVGETEKRRIINFDETDHPFSTVPEKGGSRSVRWGDPQQAKGNSCFCFVFEYNPHISHVFIC